MRASPFQEIYTRCNAGDSRQKYSNLPEFPYIIDIEMTNTCNFRCLMCPTGNLSQERVKGFMPEDVFYKILANIRPYKTPLRFIRWGEPTMHPQFLQFLRDAKAQGTLTHLNTNGSFMDDAMMEAFVDIPLDSLKFSFQGVDEKSYREMRNRDYFDELMKVIRRMHEIRGERSFPYIQVSTSITYETPEQVAFFRESLEAVTDQISVGRTVLDFIDLDKVRLKADDLEMLRWLKAQESVIKVHPECPEVFDKLSINWDGTVTACCGDSDNLMTVGDIKTQTIEEIWQSEKLNHYRDLLVEMRHDELALCKNCYDYQSLSIPGVQNTN